MDLALQLCCLLRLLLLGPVPLPECSFSWQTSRSSGISNMFGSLAQTQASHNGLSGLQCRASLDIHCQISAALSSCRGGIQDPFLVVCDLCLPPASKASMGGWCLYCQLWLLVWDRLWPSWITFAAAFVVPLSEQKIPRPFPFTNQKLSWVGYPGGILSFVSMQSGAF